VGGSGNWLRTFYSKAGARMDDVSLCNVIQCRPPDNDFPTDPDARAYISKEDGLKSVQHCLKAHVHPVLHSFPWTRIDLIGDKALEFVAERPEGIFAWRGSPVSVPELGEKSIAIPTLHPAYIARDQELIPCVVNDLRKGLVAPPEYYDPFPELETVRNFKATEFCFDIETWGWTGKVKMVGISDRPYHVLVVPFTGAYIPELKRIFRDATSVIGHNVLQFDIPVLADNEVKVNPAAQVWDTMLLQHLCFPTFPHDLEFLGSQFTSKGRWKFKKGESEEVYCARDVDVTFQSFKQLLPLVRQFQLEELYKFTQVPLARICLSMHKRGFAVDAKNIEKVRGELKLSMAKEEEYLPPEMRTHTVPVNKREPAPPGTLSPKTGKPLKFIMKPAEETVVPWRSSQKKQKFLYGTDEPWQLGLEVQYDVKKDNAITTGKVALDKLFRRSKNRGILALKQLNRWDELVTTFCKEEMVHVKRMYPHFNVHGTASGRLSSSDPNLQNIPESTRFIYVPSHAGWKILEVDYSQIENRLTAYFAGDHERLERFVRDPKFSEHKYAASLFMGVPYDEVEKSSDNESPYIKAKRIVHGTNYGEGSKKIALINDLDLKETKELHDKWKSAIRATITWQNSCAERAKRDSVLTTPFGRKRWFYTSSYFTESLSFLPQSTAADIIFRAMIALMYERIAWPLELAQRVAQVVIPLPRPAELLLQVHDSLLFEYPPEIEDDLIHTVKTVMEQAWPQLGGFSIPIGIKVGPSWGECEEYGK